MAYFTHDTPLVAHTLVRASAVNALMEAIETSFGLLPTEAELKEDRTTYATAAGSANVYTVASTYPITAYTEGFHARVKINVTNTGASTINFDGVGAKAIKRITGDALEADDLVADSAVDLTYNGTHFIASGLLSDSIAAEAAAAAAAASATEAADSATAAANALATHLKLDGSNEMAANLDMGGNKITDIGNATGVADVPRTSQVQSGTFFWGSTSGGSANAQTFNVSPGITAYAAGQTFRFIAGFTNTAAAALTININSVGAKAVVDRAGNAVPPGHVVAGRLYEASYDGTSQRVWEVMPLYLDNTITLGTTHDRTIVAGAHRIAIVVRNLSIDGTSNLILQLGDSGGIEAANYVGSSTFLDDAPAITVTDHNTFFMLCLSIGAAAVINGTILLELLDPSDNLWSISAKMQRTGAGASDIITGHKFLSAPLTTVRLTTSGGTVAFDAGTMHTKVE